MAGINAPGYSGSWIDVTYTDGSTGVLNTRIIAQDYAGGMLPVTIISNHSLPVYVEFDRPTKPVASARLTMTVTQHWSGNSTIKLFLLDPPMNSEPVTDTSGLASLAGPLDSGIKSVPGII